MSIEQIEFMEYEIRGYRLLALAEPVAPKINLTVPPSRFLLQLDDGRVVQIVIYTGDNSIRLLDQERKVELRSISLPRRPLWLNAISPEVG